MKTRWLAALVIAALSWAAALAAERMGWLNRAESVTWAWRVRAGAKPSIHSDEIRIILIDQASLSWASREMRLPWPWPREAYVPILDFCNRAGARGVAFDLIFSEPSLAGVADDETLGAAITRTPMFATGFFVGNDGDETAVAWRDDVPRPRMQIEGLREWIESGAGARDAVKARYASFPIPEIASKAAILGNVRDIPDEDTVFRSATLFCEFDGVSVPSLALAIWMGAESHAGRPVDFRIEEAALRCGDRAVPVDDFGRAILRYRGRSGTHKAYSAAAVIQSEIRLASGEDGAVVDPADLKDKFVFLGASAPGLMDLRATPIDRVYPGVEVHATALDNFLAGDFIRPVPRALSLPLSAALAIVLAMASVFGRRAWHLATAILAAFLLPLAAGFAGYAIGWWMPVVSVTLTGAVACGGGALFNYATEGRQKAFIKQAFRQYLGPEVIDQILDDPARLRLGGEKRTLTIYFSDIEKFSSFSERLDPPDLTALLNEYLTEMGHVILDEGGYVDKYIGDAIVAFWNAPVSQSDHAVRAVRAAMECQRRLESRREEWNGRFGAVVKMRVGLNTGDVTVGNMGSDERFNYTILGDAANLASRLEGANKAFGSYAMVSESVREAAPDAAIWRRLGRLRVVGRQTPVTVYEPMVSAPPWLDSYHEALALMESGDAAAAIRAFETIEGDPVSASHVARCRQLVDSGGAEWDGVIHLTEK